MNVPKKLSQKMQSLLRIGVRQAGTFQFPQAISSIEEQLTLRETLLAEAFFNWLNTEKRTFGWNLPEVYRDFTASPAADALRAKQVEDCRDPSKVTPIIVKNLHEILG
jgi:hypothetical protein